MKKTTWPDTGSIYSMSSERACNCPLLYCSSDDPLQGWTVWPPDFSITHPPLVNESKRLEVSLCWAPLRRRWWGRCCWLSSSDFGNFPASPSVSHLPGPSILMMARDWPAPLSPTEHLAGSFSLPVEMPSLFVSFFVFLIGHYLLF